MLFKLIVFAVVSAVIVAKSWASLRKPNSYGFFRFFAWESILILFLLNVGYWFEDAFSVFQIVSWFLLLFSLLLVVDGLLLLGMVGRPEGGIENTTALVKLGAYRYIRHPLYSSLLFLAWGVFFKNPSLLGGVLVLATTLFLIVTAKAEEGENLRKFGDAYAAYMGTTKTFIPFLF